MPGSELEATFGTELSGTEKDGFDFDLLAALQRGSYSNSSIQSGAGYIKAGYLLADKPLKPRLVGEFDYATGDPHNDPGHVRTFDQLYPSNHNAFGLADLFGFQNLMQTQADIDISPYRQLTVRIQSEVLHLANAHDGIYNSGGLVLARAPSTGFASTRIGQGFDISAEYAARKYILIEGGVGHFFPGPVMVQASKTSPLTIGYLSLTYRFRVNSQ